MIMIQSTDMTKVPSEDRTVSAILTLPPNTLMAGDRIEFKVLSFQIEYTIKRETRLKVRSHIPGLGT
jgi:hypothetical protein